MACFFTHPGNSLRVKVRQALARDRPLPGLKDLVYGKLSPEDLARVSEVSRYVHLLGRRPLRASGRHGTHHTFLFEIEDVKFVGSISSVCWLQFKYRNQVCLSLSSCIKACANFVASFTLTPKMEPTDWTPSFHKVW